MAANDATQPSQAAITLYDRFTHGAIGSRRELIAGLAKITGSAAAAMALLPLIEARAEAAPLSSPDDPNLDIRTLAWPGADGHRMAGYLAAPRRGAARAPSVIVIHENRGLNDHIRDVTRRLAQRGFVALAPDFLAPFGETPRSGDGTRSAEDIARAFIGKLDRAATIADGVATLQWLADFELGKGAPGAVGFCWGGGMVNALVIAAGAKLRAGVAYYGQAPTDTGRVADVRAPLLLHYAGLDERVNAGGAAWQAALTAAGKTFAAYSYEGVNHAFNNDTSAARYDKAAADLAWQRSIDWLKR